VYFFFSRALLSPSARSMPLHQDIAAYPAGCPTLRLVNCIGWPLSSRVGARLNAGFLLFCAHAPRPPHCTLKMRFSPYFVSCFVVCCRDHEIIPFYSGLHPIQLLLQQNPRLADSAPVIRSFFPLGPCFALTFCRIPGFR